MFSHSRVWLPVLGALLLPACAGLAETKLPADSDESWSQRLIAPVTAPYFFESPVIETNAQLKWLRHEFPKSSIFDGGYANIIALQLRYAVTDRFAIIATQDGWVDMNPKAGSDTHGYNDIGLGFKYALLDDKENGTIVTAGLTYIGHSGDRDVLAGTGGGAYHPFVSAGWDLETCNIIAGIGSYLPVNGDKNSQFVDWHLHASWDDGEDPFIPLVEVNGLHYTNNGRTLPVNFEAVDYNNLGSANVDGNDLITGAAGFRYRINKWTDFGMAFEAPITSRKDIFDKRVTLDLVRRF